jgi:alpha-D-ribose 1-methylphosphonate 5-triphosphate synthase subunit PhnG
MNTEKRDEAPECQQARAAWMSVLAQAPEAEIALHWKKLRNKPPFTWVKKPERGAVLLRARLDGDGPGFHCGEMTVTRCAIELEDGRIGIAYVPGCSSDHAMMAAVLDALLQREDAPGLRARQILNSLHAVLTARRAKVTAKTEATRVDFSMTAIG